LIEFITCRWQRYRGVLIVALLVAIAILLGYLAAKNVLYSLLLALLVLGCIALVYIFFKDGRLSLDRIVIPLLIVAVLLPPIRLSDKLPAVRLELVIIVIAWALFVLGQLAAGKPLRLRWHPINKWFFLFGACILASIAYAALVMGSYPIARDFWEFVKLIEYFLIFALVASLDIPPEHMRKYYIITLIVFLCSAAFGFAQFFNLFDINSWLTPYYADPDKYGTFTGYWFLGTSGNPNEFGALMFLPASLALTGALWLKGRGIKLFSWAALGIFLLALMFNRSRAAAVGVIAAAAYIIFFKSFVLFGSGRTIRMLLWAVPLLLILGLCLFQVAPDFFSVRIPTALDLSDDTSWQNRLVKWESEVDIWKQSPLLGWGPAKETLTTVTDNEWLLFLKRYGVLGVLVFILWFASIYRTLSQIGCATKNDYTEIFCTALQATLIAYAIYMIPSNVYHSLHLMPILLIFLGLAYTQRQPTKMVRQS